MAAANNSCDEQNRKHREHSQLVQFHVTGSKIGQVSCRGPDHDDRQPVVGLMRVSVAGLDHEDNDKHDPKYRQTFDMAQAKVPRAEVPHIGAEYAGNTKGGPVSSAH